MFLKGGSQLTLVGGYDFKNGVNWSDGHNYKSGDIFVDINGDAQWGQADNGASGATALGAGPHTATLANTFGWDYVLQLDFTSMTYNVFSLTVQSTVSRVMDVASSNPWTYVDGGVAVAGYQNLSLSYIAGLTNADTGFDGGDSTNSTGWSTGSDQHYALGVDLSFIAWSGRYDSLHDGSAGTTTWLAKPTSPPCLTPAPRSSCSVWRCWASRVSDANSSGKVSWPALRGRGDSPLLFLCLGGAAPTPSHRTVPSLRHRRCGDSVPARIRGNYRTRRGGNAAGPPGRGG